MRFINKEKLDKIKLDPHNMYVVIDFDRTITAKDSQDSWDAAATMLGEEFAKKSYELYQKYRPIEQDYTITYKEKTKAMEIWYKACMDLYYEYGLTKEKLEKSVQKSGLKFRDGMKDFLKEMYEKDVPVIICSAGIGNVIELYLKDNNCYYENMYIISNFLTFNAEGQIEEYKNKLIHTMNKTINGNLPKEIQKKLEGRQYKLLLGDTIEDKQMIDESEASSTITVGFLNDKIEQNLELYKKEFDVCVVEDVSPNGQNVQKETSQNVPMLYDVIIVGAGPAGISASLYVGRANLKTLVLYAGESASNEEASALEKTDKIENYYGFANGVNGKKLYEEGIEQAKNIGIEIKNEEVVKIEREDKFIITTSKAQYKTKSVILSTGNKKNKPKIEGIKDLEGKGVSYCAICDGFFYKNKNVAVLGSGDYAISETNDLINIANDITILTNGKTAPEFRADNVKIDTRKVKAIKGENRVEKVEFEDGNNLEVDGVFVAQGVAGSGEFAKKLGLETQKENIVVNQNMETNIKGLFACGDCTGGVLQIAKAVYEGMIAGMQAIKYIKMEEM